MPLSGMWSIRLSPATLVATLILVSVGSVNGGSGDSGRDAAAVPRGSKTDITGLRLEDVVGDLRSELDRSAHSLRISNVPLHEVVKLQAELSKGMNQATPTSRRWVEAGNLADYNGLKKEPYLTVLAFRLPLPCDDRARS